MTADIHTLHPVSTASMVETAMGALGRAEDIRRNAIMARVRTILTADAVCSELHTQMRLMGHDELTASQEAAWDAAESARESARKALPSVLGLTEDDLKLLGKVL